MPGFSLPPSPAIAIYWIDDMCPKKIDAQYAHTKNANR